MNFGPAVVTRFSANTFLTTEQLRRRQHGVQMHGRDFWSEGTHKIEHERSTLAISILRGEHESIDDPHIWVGEITLVAHEHEDGVY